MLHRPAKAQSPKSSPECEGARASLRKGTRGAVYVEFLICFIPIWVMLLGMIQIGLVYTAHLVVQHAATTAVRAAVVVIPEDPARYDNATAYNVVAGSSTSNHSVVTRFIDLLGSMSGALSSFGFGGGGGGGGGSGAVGAAYPTRNGRYDDIWQAASIPLTAIAPQPSAVWPSAFGRHPAISEALGSTDRGNLIDNPAARAAVGATVYNNSALAVTFPSGPGATSYVSQWTNPHDPTQAPMVYVRVTYMFHCAVPIAAQLMCMDPIDLTLGIPYSTIRSEFARIGSSPSLGAIAEAIQNINSAQDRLHRAQPGVEELSIAPWWGFLAFTSFTGSRYVIMRSEAGMPLQVGYDSASDAGAPAADASAPAPADAGRHSIRGCCSSHGGAATCNLPPGGGRGALVCSDGWTDSSCWCDGTEWTFTRDGGSH